MTNNQTYDDFFEALGNRESNGDYKIENSYGYIGKYQMGEALMYDIGYYTFEGDSNSYRKNDWKGKWTSKNGINSKNDFLNAPEEQEKAVRESMHLRWKSIKHLGLEKFIGKTVLGVEITISGMLAGCHLKGAGGLKEFLEKEDDNVDGYGTEISEYIKKFGGYQTPFDNDYSIAKA